MFANLFLKIKNSIENKKTSNPNALSPPGGYAAACVARYGSFSFLRGVVAPIAAINRYSCACARVHAWLCAGERLRIPACTLRSTPRGRSFSAAGPSRSLPPPLFARGPILGMKFARLSPPSRGAESVESHGRTSIRNFGYRFSKAETNS